MEGKWPTDDRSSLCNLQRHHTDQRCSHTNESAFAARTHLAWMPSQRTLGWVCRTHRWATASAAWVSPAYMAPDILLSLLLLLHKHLSDMLLRLSIIQGHTTCSTKPL